MSTVTLLIDVNNTPVDVFAGMLADVIEMNGWRTGSTGFVADSPVCLLGAGGVVVAGAPEMGWALLEEHVISEDDDGQRFGPLAPNLMRQLGLRLQSLTGRTFGSTSSFYRFNDQPGMTERRIIAALRAIQYDDPFLYDQGALYDAL